MSKIVRNIPDGLEASYADIKLDTISDLVNLTGTPPEIAWVSGHHTKGDGSYGSHIFEWDHNSTEPHNGGTIIELGATFPTDWSDQTQLDTWFNYSGGTTGRYKLKYDNIVNVKMFGAVGDNATDDTFAIQKTFDCAKDYTKTIDFEHKKTYNTSSTILLQQYGSNEVSNIELNGNGARIICSANDYCIRFFRVQGIKLHDLKVSSNGTFYTCLDSMWFIYAENCSFGNTEIKSASGWGFYWNTFVNCHFSNIYFNQTNGTINQNAFIGGHITGAISRAPFLSDAAHKESYSNTFYGIDINGSIDWTDPTYSLATSPLILQQCNVEADATVKGNVNMSGGKLIPSGSARLVDIDTLSNTYDMIQSGSQRQSGWYPYNVQNLISGGCAQNKCDYLKMLYVNTSPRVYYDATSPISNNYVWKCSYSGNEAYPSIAINLPTSYLEEVKLVGFVSISFWYRAVTGHSVRYNLGGSDSYPGYTSLNTDGNWHKYFINIPVSKDATKVQFEIGGNSTTNMEVYLTGIQINIGKIAFPYVEYPDKYDKTENNVHIYKDLIADGTSQDIGTFNVSNGIYQLEIIGESSYSGSLGGANYKFIISRFDSGDTTTVSTVYGSVAGAGYGGAPGTIQDITLEVDADDKTLIHIKSTISNYSNNPTITCNWQVNFDKKIDIAVS